MAKNPKQYDLEDRTLAFAKKVRAFVKKLRRTIANIEDGKQLIRASELTNIFGSILAKSK
jgi:hypothetical protein